LRLAVGLALDQVEFCDTVGGIEEAEAKTWHSRVPSVGLFVFLGAVIFAKFNIEGYVLNNPRFQVG
jgi:hypothetical protein